MSFTDVYLGNLTVKNNTIDLGGSKFVNTGDATNGSDIPSKAYVDTSIRTYTDGKVFELNKKIDNILQSVNNQLYNTNNNNGDTVTVNADETAETVVVPTPISKSYVDTATTSLSVILTNYTDSKIMAEQNRIDASLLTNTQNIVTQLTAETTRAETKETTLTNADTALQGRCDTLQSQINTQQEQINHLYNFFFATNASVHPTR